MCDSHVLLNNEGIWFAKNSDREASEPQYLEFYPASSPPASGQQRCSYINIAADRPTLAYYLSRPSWLWGGEMGVNEAGVCIGNEAVFSKTRSLKPALLGMDLVRLGLARGHDATDALEHICQLLEQYGQGGPCGFRDKKMHYDSSFLIADAKGCWKLETAGRVWAAKYYARPKNDAAQPQIGINISNRLSIGSDYDRSATGLQAFAEQQGWPKRKPVHFSRCFDSKLLPYFAAAKSRQQQGQQALETLAKPDWKTLAQLLRSHRQPGQSAKHGSNHDRCMHAGGLIRQSQTTNSLIVNVSHSGIRGACTGASAPCLSVFRPFTFESTQWTLLAKQPQPLWQRQERLHRRALFNAPLAADLQADIQRLEAKLFKALNENGDSADALEAADIACEQTLQRRLNNLPRLKTEPSRYGYYWRWLNKKDGIV